MRVTGQNASAAAIINDVLLQTFWAWMMVSERFCYMRGVINNGSQRTFVKESVASKLKLAAVAETELSISAFRRVCGPKER